MKSKRRRAARKGSMEELCLEKMEGSGPWDGELDPEVGNTQVRRFMKWYRKRLGLSLHQVAALTHLDRAHLRRLEKLSVRLTLVVLWRWANGLHVNVDWVLGMARRNGLQVAR